MEVSMKKFKLYLAIIMCLLMIPFTVFADEADTDSKDEATTEEKVESNVKANFWIEGICLILIGFTATSVEKDVLTVPKQRNSLIVLKTNMVSTIQSLIMKLGIILKMLIYYKKLVKLEMKKFLVFLIF